MQDNICQQIESIHSEWSKMSLTDKIAFIIRCQVELNSMNKKLAQSRMLKGYFTPEEVVAVRQLQDIQIDLNNHKVDIKRELKKEISKELFKAIANLGRVS